MRILAVFIQVVFVVSRSCTLMNPICVYKPVPLSLNTILVFSTYHLYHIYPYRRDSRRYYVSLHRLLSTTHFAICKQCLLHGKQVLPRIRAQPRCHVSFFGVCYIVLLLLFDVRMYESIVNFLQCSYIETLVCIIKTHKLYIPL